MAMIHSVGTAVPEQQLTQEDAKNSSVLLCLIDDCDAF